MSNILRDELKELLFHQSESEMDAIMEVVEKYLEEAFYSAQETHGCYNESVYRGWKHWYDSEINRPDVEGQQ